MNQDAHRGTDVDDSRLPEVLAERFGYGDLALGAVLAQREWCANFDGSTCNSTTKTTTSTASSALVENSFMPVEKTTTHFATR